MSIYNPGLIQQMGLQSSIQAPPRPDDLSAGLGALSDRFAANSNNEDALFPIEGSNPYDSHGATAPKPDTNLDRGPAPMPMGPGMGPGMGDMGGMDTDMDAAPAVMGAQDMMAQMYADRMRQRAAKSQQFQGQAEQMSGGMKQGAY